MLSTLQTNKQDQNNCGETNWRAASNTLRKKKNLSETGLEIAGCRHSLAQKAVNMMYGEIYGYAHYLQKSYFIPKQVKYFWYDVVCKFWPWLQKHDGESAKNMKPALSVMHAKAHSWSCQVGYCWNWINFCWTSPEICFMNRQFHISILIILKAIKITITFTIRIIMIIIILVFL